MGLTPCPRLHCAGSLLWGACHLCGRSLTPPTVGGPRQRQQSARRQKPEEDAAALARRVLAPPERSARWDPDLQAYVIDELDIPEAESLMATPPAPIRYSLRAAVARPHTF